MDTLSYIIGRNSAGSAPATTPTWSDVTGKPFSTVGEGLEVSDGALKECVPLYKEEEQGEQYTEEFSYQPEKYESGYSASVDTDWRYYNMYQDPTIDFRWKLEDDTEYRITSTFYFTNDDEIYEDDGGYHWKIKVQGNASVYLILECQDELPADAKDSAEATVTVYIQDVIENYHQLPAEYIQIDDNTIVNENGYLVATGPSSVDYMSEIVGGMTIGYINVDSDPYEVHIPDTVSSFANDAGYITATALTPYVESSSLATVATSGLYSDLSGAPSIPVVTASASTLTHGETIGSIEIDGVTTTFKGEYVPRKTSQLTNDADFLSASDTGITNTLSSGTAIGDLTIYGVTTTLYAPAGGTAATPNWNATSGQDGYIDNKPAIKKGNGMDDALYIGTGGASGTGAIAIGRNVYGKGLNTVAIGRDIMNSYIGSYPSDPNYFFGDGVNPYTTAPTVPTMYRGYKNLNWNDISNPQVNYLDIIGNGTSSARSNAEATDWSGNKYLAGDIYVNVTDWANPTTNSIKLANIPAAPTTTAATLTLQATVDGSGNVTYAWV